ncbi:P-loop containing nucleoside triphosphate hydrolase protein [Auricularia subglabra TFB-10046 SS5]|nr:P-loop containing nucleoside triphosphate hydrolase protein [Auricularia subglabra TFB-10046 SS5]
MLDHCSISHKGGVVLWQRSFTPAAETLAASAASPVNNLVREALIDSRAASDSKYEKDGYAIKWSFVNDLELIFVVAYQRILQLTYVDDLIAALKALFVKLYEPFLRSFSASLHAVSAGTVNVDTVLWDFAVALEGWDKYFDQVLKKFEDKAAQERRTRRAVPASPAPTPSPPSDDTPELAQTSAPDGQEIARNVHAFKARGRGRGRGGRPQSGGRTGSDSDSAATAGKKKPAKVMRKWGDEALSESDMTAFDFSGDKPAADAPAPGDIDIDALVDRASMGARNKDGLYEVKDWVLDADAQAAPAANTGSFGALSNVFARFTGGKVLTAEDLTPVLNAMKEHLMKKNVAKEIADKVCESVGESLIGKKVSGFKTVKAEVQNALSASLTRILTPKTSTDLLLSIRAKLANAAASSSADAKRTPYAITFVGVNGVGKSTNLSKVCFWLIQNGFKVLIAACDTFRSGAVEQLRVHVRNLGMLAEGEQKGSVELYERGYGKDAAGIAKEAIAYAKESAIDVVLIDTAGRMQDNEPLMRALAKLVSTNNPDKIIFVGEALVGNEAVDQLQKFDRALRDFSSVGGGPGTGRGIDGMLVTKWDTVDDKVGAALSMTYVTGQPIIFVGCGQTYTDLRQLRVGNVVQALLSD